MNIHELMQKFAELDYTTVGRGPKHPSFPRLELQAEVESFLAQYEFLQQDKGYVDFLECYAGGMIDYPNGEVFVDIFGFLDEVSFHLTKDEGSIIEDNGYYGFCTSVIRIGQSAIPAESDVGIGYAFDATGNRRWGIYRFIEGGEGEWYCESFLKWLEQIITKKGNLL